MTVKELRAQLADAGDDDLVLVADTISGRTMPIDEVEIGEDIVSLNFQGPK